MKIFIGRKYSCNLNYQHDFISESLSASFEITEKVEEADILVFASSCACTEDTIIKNINYLYECVQKKKPEAKVYLTGCLTREFKNKDLFKDELEWLEENIDYIIPQNKSVLLLQMLSDKFKNENPEDFGYAMYTTDITEVYIGNGCLNNCAFCKTYYQHYPLKSVPIEEIKSIIDKSDEFKIPNIRLIGTNVSEYGLDLYSSPKLPELILYIEAKDHIKHIDLVGFGYKDAIKYNFANSLADSRKISIISGALETGSPRLLEMIRKGFTPEEIIEFVKFINSKYPKHLLLNIIAGLPTETLEDIKLTLDVLKEIEPYKVDICEYVSSSYLTYLNSYPQLTDKEIASHRKIYNEVLTRRKVKTRIVCK